MAHAKDWADTAYELSQENTRLRNALIEIERITWGEISADEAVIRIRKIASGVNG